MNNTADLQNLKNAPDILGLSFIFFQIPYIVYHTPQGCQTYGQWPRTSMIKVVMNLIVIELKVKTTTTKPPSLCYSTRGQNRAIHLT